MTYKAKLLTGMIAVLFLIASVVIGLHIYWYLHSGMPRWGSSLALLYMLFSMLVVTTTIMLSARHEQIEKRRKRQDTHGR